MTEEMMINIGSLILVTGFVVWITIALIYSFKSYGNKAIERAQRETERNKCLLRIANALCSMDVSLSGLDEFEVVGRLDGEEGEKNAGEGN